LMKRKTSWISIPHLRRQIRARKKPRYGWFKNPGSDDDQ
jgi:hypothetical protein